MKFLLAQIHNRCGDLKNNLGKIITAWDQHDAPDTLIIFPEMALTGYPIEDLADNSQFYQACETVLERLIAHSRKKDSTIVLSHLNREGDKLYNCLFVIERGKVLKQLNKTYLPNYGVFDEKRNFHAGNNNTIFNWHGCNVGFLICEDMWHPELATTLKDQGAEILICLNASPYDLEKASKRAALAEGIASSCQLALLYVNCYGAQDELVFDGGSFSINSQGKYLLAPQHWKKGVFEINLMQTSPAAPFEVHPNAHVYNALILSLRSYLHDNNFQKALIAVSGGIDSAMVATLAADAIGAENIILVRLPSQYSSDHSLSDAEQLATNLCGDAMTIPINDAVDALTRSLAGCGSTNNITNENLQSRARGVLMMALSNNTGAMLLSTGNKSEYACGYATIYGDMCGGFAPIKDLYKTQIYQLCNYRNAHIPSLSLHPYKNVIPQNSIDKPPSAELKPDQLDSDNLPDYGLLDQILFELIEKDSSIEALIKAGYDKKIVKRVAKLIKLSEYKRRQAPIGTKISIRNFGKDRRYPITNLYNNTHD